MTSHPRRSAVRDWPAFLKRFRASHGLTQKKLADLLAISARVVEEWESGRNNPKPYLKRALRDLERDIKAKSVN